MDVFTCVKEKVARMISEYLRTADNLVMLCVMLIENSTRRSIMRQTVRVRFHIILLCLRLEMVQSKERCAEQKSRAAETTAAAATITNKYGVSPSACNVCRVFDSPSRLLS